jgi:hypothetical protein
MTIDLEAIDEAGCLEAGILEVLVEKLSPYDPADVLAAVGGLQLLPENADRAVRLEATTLLLEQRGVSQVAMPVSGMEQTSLPTDSSRIHLLVLSRSA